MERHIRRGLIADTHAHFAAEERLMQQSRFAGYATHKAEHDALTRRVLRLGNLWCKPVRVQFGATNFRDRVPRVLRGF